MNPIKLNQLVQSNPFQALKKHVNRLTAEQLDLCIRRAPGYTLQQAIKRLSPKQRDYCILQAPGAALEFLADQLSLEEFDICVEKCPLEAFEHAKHRLTSHQVDLCVRENSKTALEVTEDKFSQYQIDVGCWCFSWCFLIENADQLNSRQLLICVSRCRMRLIKYLINEPNPSTIAVKALLSILDQLGKKIADAVKIAAAKCGEAIGILDEELLLPTTRQAPAKALVSLSLRDTDHETTVLEQRQSPDQKIDSLETLCQTFAGESVATELVATTAACDAAREELSRRIAIPTESGSATASADQDTFRASLTDARAALAAAESMETTAYKQADQSRKRLEAATTVLARRQEETASARQALRDLEFAIKAHEEAHGDETTRAVAISAGSNAETQSATKLKTTCKPHEALNPDLLDADRLTLDGSTSSEGEFRHAEARHATAHENQASEQRRAKPIETLHHLVTSSRRNIPPSELVKLDLTLRNSAGSDSYMSIAQGPAGMAADVRGIIEQTRSQVDQVGNAGMTPLNWRIGKCIQMEILGNQRAEYGKEILATLSQELSANYGVGFSYSALTRMVRFAETFPDGEILATLSPQLGWSHFKEIIPLKSDLQRDFYAEMCRDENWNVRILRSKIASRLFERTAISDEPDGVARAELAALNTEGQLIPALV